MFRLQNPIRDYAWGSPTAIAELTGRTPTGAPEAEMWIGAHPGAPSVVVLGDDDAAAGLDAFLAARPQLLGQDVMARFGRLPFLTKLLAADAPLSLQVHPSLAQAKAGFASEEAAGVDPAAAHRNYKDDNHKPEMIFALTPFTALCGFREPEGAARLFAALESSGVLSEAASGAARALVQLLEAGELSRAFTTLLGGARRQVPATVKALTAEAPAAVAELQRRGEPVDPGLAEIESLSRHYPGDPGSLISLLLNHVTLEPGQAIALPAGNVHAYLRGLGVEVMASSDNVLRGGLTPKHVDVAELLRTVDFRPLPVPYVEPSITAAGAEIYRPGFDEFQLQRVCVSEGRPAGLEANGPVVVVATDGEVRLSGTDAAELTLRPGEAALVGADEPGVTVSLGAPGADGTTGTAFAVTLPTA